MMPRTSLLRPGVLLAALTLACSAPTDPTGGDAPVSASPLVGAVQVTRFNSEPVAFTANSGLVESRRLVVRDADAWASTWAAVWRNMTPAPSRPDVDFSREMVIVAALGQRTSGGYDIVVDSATATESELVVHVRATSPGASCFVTGALTQPVDIVRLPATTLPVKFVEDAVVHECQ
jgi:hypothetical protein